MNIRPQQNTDQNTNTTSDFFSKERTVLDAAEVPVEARRYLLEVLNSSNLTRTARLEILKELVAHLEDGLAAGKKLGKLLDDFGDGNVLGGLIRKSRPDAISKPRRLRRIWRCCGEVAVGFSQDLRQVIRGLRRSPGFASAAILTLALGVGANTAVFSAVHGILMRPLPYPAAQELVVPVLTNPAKNVLSGPVGYADYLRWKEETGVFKSVGLYADWNLNITGDAHPERIKGAIVSHRFFEVLNAPPVIGRTFSPEEHEPGGGRVAILSEVFWRRRFHGDPGIIGTTVLLDEEPYEVIGVIPLEAQWPSEAEIWMPLTFGAVTPDWVLERDAQVYSTIARLQPGVTLSQASAVVDQVARRAAAERPDTRAGFGATAVPLRTYILGDSTPRALWLLMGCAGFILLIVCSNVANLTLERSLTKKREIAIRASIGAGRVRSIRPIVLECLIVALLGGVLGVAVAFWGTGALADLAPNTLPDIRDLGVDLRVLVFGLVISALTGVGFSLAPALLAVKLDLHQTLTDSCGRTGSGPAAGKARNAMSVAQLALSVVLVLGAGLAAKSTLGLVRTNPGFLEDGVLTMKIFLPHRPPTSTETEIQAQTYRDFTERLAALPGAISASAVSALPLSADGLFENISFQVAGSTDESHGTNQHANWNIVDVDFFATVGIPLQKGRGFSRLDLGSSPRVAVISESFARKLFHDRNPVGERILSGSTLIDGGPIEVVGVVSDVRYTGMADAGRSVIYVPFAQSSWRAMAMVVRFRGNAAQQADAVREAIWSVEPSAPVTDVRTMASINDESSTTPRFATSLVAAFALLASVIAVVGVYGVINVSLRQRYHELGVRKALGADGRNVYMLLIGQGAKLAAAGVVIGLPAGLALSRLMSGLLFEVKAHDPMILVCVPLLLAGCVMLATALPARRASRIEPIEALRAE